MFAFVYCFLLLILYWLDNCLLVPCLLLPTFRSSVLWIRSNFFSSRLRHEQQARGRVNERTNKREQRKWWNEIGGMNGKNAPDFIASIINLYIKVYPRLERVYFKLCCWEADTGKCVCVCTQIGRYIVKFNLTTTIKRTVSADTCILRCLETLYILYGKSVLFSLVTDVPACIFFLPTKYSYDIT